jgi:peptidyl-prolyl cis-trans isomerase SurA
MSARLQFAGMKQIRSAGVLAFFVVLGFAAGGAQAANSVAGTNPMQPAKPPGVGAAPMDGPASPLIPSHGTQLDRIVAIVNGELILDSDVDEERRFSAFDPYRNYAANFSRDQAIERLINRDLILQQLKLEPQNSVSDAAVTKQIDQLRKTIPGCQREHCETKEGWDHFLAAQGFTESVFFARWKQRMEVLQFVQERFQVGVRITPEQIKEYYDQTMLPVYARRHATAPALETVSEQIQQVLLQQQVTNLLNDWLASLHAQGDVIVLHPGEEAP